MREGGRVYVLLGGDQGTTSRDQGSAQYADHHDRDGHHYHEHDGGGSRDHRDELVKELRNRVRYLEEESRRKDHIIMTMAQRIPELLPPSPPPASAPRDAPQTVAEEPEGMVAPITSAAPQEAAESRSWRRRWFGFE